jgi:hypothetical protein
LLRPGRAGPGVDQRVAATRWLPDVQVA